MSQICCDDETGEPIIVCLRQFVHCRVAILRVILITFCRGGHLFESCMPVLLADGCAAGILLVPKRIYIHLANSFNCI